MTAPAPTGRTIGGRFAAGNPGKPKGARHKTTLAIESLLDKDANAITRKAIALAKDGDMTAIRLCLERLAPPRRGRTVHLPDMPKVESVSDVPKAIAYVLEQVAGGEITADEAADITALLGRYAEACKTIEYEERLKALEQRFGQR
ncbi:DUF5681 domain-containing protein [Devosia sp. RR2S18]|uniref:DUF5681 domain-containing protein n=1 Tax=Devosia rhizosphaerae TaxID=3049774 RepID=UPI0025414F0D|nr:DUF5681 domain-containing protein [Devosia sp. RR2S18]WIJ26609.1 hypothetical protein QOV41_07615 [Devosia sp. RR2S18]